MVGGGARREWVDGREPRVNQGELLSPSDVGTRVRKRKRDNKMIEEKKVYRVEKKE